MALQTRLDAISNVFTIYSDVQYKLYVHTQASEDTQTLEFKNNFFALNSLAKFVRIQW